MKDEQPPKPSKVIKYGLSIVSVVIGIIGTIFRTSIVEIFFPDSPEIASLIFLVIAIALITLGLVSVAFFLWHGSQVKKWQEDRELLDKENQQLKEELQAKDSESAELKGIIADSKGLRERTLADEYSETQKEEKRRHSNRD